MFPRTAPAMALIAASRDGGGGSVGMAYPARISKSHRGAFTLYPASMAKTGEVKPLDVRGKPTNDPQIHGGRTL